VAFSSGGRNCVVQRLAVHQTTIGLLTILIRDVNTIVLRDYVMDLFYEWITCLWSALNVARPAIILSCTRSDYPGNEQRSYNTVSLLFFINWTEIILRYSPNTDPNCRFLQMAIQTCIATARENRPELTHHNRMK
jgi:hypothetical protein